ncbi:pseudouridine synthase, partial [Spirosoma sp. 209]|uniref:pseudouridine synthase n=1 Tax=Spirosoma sp. 209 TaxID=1955701 RepID=UPI0011169DDE
DKPAFKRVGGFNRDADERNRSFERGNDDRPRFDRSRDEDTRSTRRNDDSRSNDRPGDRPRVDRGRDDRNTDRPRPFSDRRSRSDEGASERPRFDRGRNDRPDRADKPAFKRVGGFNRDADERNRSFERGNDDRPRFDRSRDEDTRSTRRNDDSRSNDRDRTDGPYKFTPEQRKESGERRTGRYEKAPNYNIDQRPYERRSRREDSEPSRPSADRSAKAYRTDRKAPARPVDDRSRTSEPGDPNTTRLNRYIANSGVCSRREADELISKGDITVNGKVVTEMGFRVKDGDTVKYGTKVLNPERFVYVLLNKPKDYITTTDDPEERKTVMELVADAGNFRLYPVGRLDRKTTGLLLLTNDGELADKLTHPSNNIRKIYQVEIDKPITEADFETLLKGIELEDGPIKPDSMSIITPDAQVVGIEIHSGRNRIVRRMFEHLGYEVTKLDRTTFAGLTKKELPRGKWRFLDPKEVVKLKYLN